MTSLVKILKCLEHPRYPCLGPHMRLLSLTGFWHPNLNSKLARFKLTLLYLCMSFFISQYIKCLIHFDVDGLKLILQYAPFHMGLVKTLFFQKDYKKWERVIRYISEGELEQISKKDSKQDGIINDYINRSRRVTYFFWGLALFSNFSIFTEPYQKNEICENGTSVYLYIFDGYTPFAREPPGYYISMLIQTVFGHMMSAYVVAWDMLVVSIMIFFAGQLKISILHCKRVIDLENPENSHKNIANCHEFHTKLVLYQTIFNELISPVMFVYLVVICISLGVCIIEIVQIQDNLPALVSGCLFIMACLIQLLLFYWHGNEVAIESQRVRYSTFESQWLYADRKIQKEVGLLAQTTQKKLVFSVGPFNDMSLTTFIAILRASYSFFTLINETSKES